MQSLESIPTWFADLLSIELNAAQILLSAVVILIFLLPTLLLSKDNRLPPLIMLFLSTALLVGVGWAPFWLLAMIIAICALAVAVFGRKILGG